MFSVSETKISLVDTRSQQGTHLFITLFYCIIKHPYHNLTFTAPLHDNVQRSRSRRIVHLVSIYAFLGFRRPGAKTENSRYNGTLLILYSKRILTISAIESSRCTLVLAICEWIRKKTILWGVTAGHESMISW